MKPLHLFEAYGVELEYMIVHRDHLNVMPIADQLMKRAAGYLTDEVAGQYISWSNELVLHVVELKTTAPAHSLTGLADRFSNSVNEINGLLSADSSMLLPSAMHPLMKAAEMQLWPHGNRDIYEAYNRIFNCQGHGWANLQSVHLNLPFNGNGEFARLHTAIRIILPLLPALAASSPVMEGKISGLRDTRLNVYKQNQAVIPQIAGKVIPEPVISEKEYNKVIFQPMYRAIAPHDPGKILQEEWLNSRGAIARFDRNAIEIRVIDIQECPMADLAILQLVCAVLQELVSERLSPFSGQFQMETDELAAILTSTIKDGEDAVIENVDYLKVLGMQTSSATAEEIWKSLLQKVNIPEEAQSAIDVILTYGTLSSRISRSLPPKATPEDITDLYAKLAVCLGRNQMFVPDNQPVQSSTW